MEKYLFRNFKSLFFNFSFLIVFVFSSSSCVFGQVSAYTFAQTTGTYSAIAGTNVGFGTAWDDNIASLTIPFAFVFNGAEYTSLSVNTNGYVTFGATTSATNLYTPISAATAYAGCISAFGRDLVQNGVDVTYTTSGSAPNRVFIVQWNNARRYNASAARNGNYNFQIRLNEASNVVQVVYNVATSTYGTALTHQIGLRGATNADYNNRTSSTNFSSTTAGGSNAATVTTHNTVALNPIAGLTYTWTPPVSTAPTSITGTTNICAGSSTTLTTSGGTLGTDAVNLWSSESCLNHAYFNPWASNLFTASAQQTTFNPTTSGTLNVTSTGGDPFIVMPSLGSFDPTVYKYINVRFRVTSATQPQAIEIFWYNTAFPAANGAQYKNQTVSTTQNQWTTVSLDMSVTSAGSWTGSNITGWRYDWATTAGVTMEIDFISLSNVAIVGEGSSVSVSPSSNTTYYTQKAGMYNRTTCVSQEVTVNALPSAGTVTSNPASGPICDNTSVSASVSAGSGGAGTVTDEIQYMINGGAWTTYSAAVTATASSSTVAGSIQFRTRRTATGAGCTTSSYNTTTSIAVHNASIGWANLETQNGTICATTGSHTIRGRVWKDGYTIIAGADANFQVQVGYNSANTNPNGWSTWSAATWLEQTGDDDRYTATLTGLAAGTYYYAIRYRYLSCGTWYYGGYSGTGGGAYDGSANINGVLTVNASPTASAGAALSNICRGTSTAQMGGSVGGGATGATWSGGSGSWTNPTNASTAVYNAAANESGTITLTLTATAPTGCTSVTDSKTLTFTAVSSSPTITGPICPGNTTVSGTGVNGSTIKVIRGGSEIQSGSATWSGTSWSITVSSVSAGESLTATQTESGKCVSDASAAYVVITPASFGNIQFPATSQVICGSPVTFYGQVYRAGTTEAAGQGASLTADLGWSSTNTNPNTWTNWTSATFNTQSGNNDEFSAALGAGLTEGNWFYAFRYNYAGCTIYGGYGGIYGSGGSNGTATVPPAQTATLSSAAGTNAQTVCKGLSIVNITYTIGNGATNANVTGLPTGVTASLSGTTPNILLTISGTVAHSNVAGTSTYTITTSGTSTSNCPFTITGTITANESVDFANLQSPASGGVCTAGSFTVYGQVYEPAVTPGAGQGGGITVQAGYNASNTNPNTWSTWQATTYNSGVNGNNDEYSSTFSSLNTDGVYYYAFKYTNNASGCVTYGGYSVGGGGTWDGSSNVSGVMTVMGPTAGTIGTGQTLCNTGSGVTPAAFTSTADGSGSGTISYEWQTNASGSYATIAGANSATYQAPTLTATTSYQRRTVSTSGGVTCYSAYTSPITVTVNNAISITGQPNTSVASVCLNGAAFTALTVTATGTSPTYQWQQSADGSTNWITAVGGTGGTTSSYTPPNNLVGTLYYRCVVSGASPCSSVNSDPSGARNVLSVPTITSFSPAAGCTGTTITINGTNFVNGSTTVTVNGIAATSVTFVSSSQITVVQPTGVTGTGNIVVTLPGSCSATSSSTFSLLAVPAQPSAITGTANPEVGATTQAYSVTNVAGVNYTWSFPSGWTITSGQGTNSVQVTVGSVNGTISVTPSNCAGNGTATTLSTTIPAYRAKFTGVNFGASTWCTGTSRSVTVNVTNTGTATWTDAGPDINIGVKWNTNTTNWNDYMYRQNAGGLAPGASQVYTFASLQASNATANVAPPSVPTYGTNLATGTNILSFDVVAEDCFWFSGNTANATCPGVVSGNSVYQSTSITITDVPAQPSAITGTASVCSNVSQSYSVTNVAGLTYNWTFPSGWTQTAGGTTNSVTVTTGAAGGSISVTAANTCGNSTARTLAVANAGPTSVSGGSDATTCYNVGTQLSGSATAPILTNNTVFSENFNSGIPGTWTTTNTSTGGTPANASWTSRANAYVYSFVTYNSNDASSFVMSNSDNQGSGSTTNTSLASPTFSLANYTAASLTFYHYYRTDDNSFIEISTNGGTTYSTLATLSATVGAANGFVLNTIDLTSYVGQVNLRIRFRYAATWGYYWAIDNVRVSGTVPAPITYAWSPTTGLSSSTISNPTATLTSDATYTMTATSNGCSVAASPITITVRPQFTPGAIATIGETICSGGTPSQIGSTTAASGGDNSITYSWRSSADSYATAISGATDATYTPPSGLSTTTSYRRYAKDNTCNLTPTVSTGTWTVTVNATPTAGAIASAQSICNGNAPSSFTSSTDGTGTGIVSYEWQTNASGSYATIGSEISSTYQAPVLTTTTSYQRRTVAVSGGVTCYSTYTSPVTITVNSNPTLSGITSSSTTVCAGDVATITLSGILDVPQTISYTIGGTVGTQTATVTGSGGTATFNTVTLIAANSGQTITITGITRTDVTPNCPFTPSSGYTATLPSVNSCSLITPSTSSLTAFTACTNVASSEQSFTVIGSDLTADILVTAPTGFEVSLTSGSGFGGSVSLTQSGGSVASTTIYVRLLAASTPVNANITLTTTGAVTQNVAVSGTVNQPLSAVTISGTNNQAICSNASGSLLTVSETNGGVITVRQWGYRTTSEGAITAISGATGTTYTPVGTDLPAGIAYVVCTSTPTCGSATVSNEITVTTTVLPTITASTSNFGCGTGTVDIAATASAGTIEWFDASTNGTSLGTSNSAATWTTPSIASTTIFYAEAVNGSCRSTARTAVTATVNSIPTVTFTAQPGSTSCSSSNVTYTTQSGQANYVWTFPGTLNTDYTITSGGTTSSNTVTLQYLTAGSKTVSVNYASFGCSALTATNSTATTVSLTPAAPAVSDVTICVGESAILSASSGNQIKWYDGLGNFIGNNSSLNVSPSGNTTYYAVAQAGTVNVVPYSASTTFVVPTGVEQVKVEAWGAGGSGGAGRGNLGFCLYCYSAGGGGGGGAFSRSTFNVIAGQNYTLTVGLGVAGTATSNGSAGGSSVFTGPAGTVTALGGSGGVRGADGTPGAGGAGGIGLFNGGNGAAGDLSSFYNNGGGGGGGAGNAANGANASMASDAVGGPGGAGGIGSPNISPYFGGAGGSFPIATSTSAGSAGSVPGGGGSGGGGDVANRAGGIGGNGRIVLTYTSYTGCASALTPVLVTVNPAPTVNAGSAMSAICSGQTSAQLGGSIGGSATGGTWTHNGAGSLTNPTDPSAATYTAGASESGTVTLTLTTTGGGCTAVTATKTIVVNAIPAAPTVPVNLTICQSGIGNISVTAPTLTSSQNVAFNIATEPTETNAAPGNQIATATISALPSGTTITSAALTVNNLTALGGSYMSEVMLGLSGAVTYSAVAGSSTGAAGAFNYSSTVSSGITVNTASTALNLLYWDYANDNFGADCTFGAPKTANLTINYSYPATINWYDAATGGTLLGTGASFNPIGTTVLPNANTAGTYNFYAEAVSNGCASARVLVTVTVQNANNTTVAAIVGSDLVEGDYLWNGNTTTSWETAANWFKHDGTNFLYSTTVPTASNRVFVLTNANAGSSCISTTNLATVNVSVGTGAASDVFIGAGATMLMDAGKILNVSGNWTNNGLFTPNATASVVFNGTGAQAIGGSSTTTFTNLEVNKTSGLLTLNTPANVSGTLTMTAGNIATRLIPTVTNLLTVGTSASATGTIAWTSGSVLGPIKRWFAAGTNSSDASSIFPVGLSTKNRWAKLNFTSGLTTGGSVIAEYRAGLTTGMDVVIPNPTDPLNPTIYPSYAGLPAYVNGHMVTNYENEGYWEITPTDGDLTTLNAAQYSLTLRGNALSTVSSAAAMSQLRMIKSSGPAHTSWDNGGIGLYTSNFTGSSNPADFTITNTAMTGFSWFNIGSGQISWLPVELTNFAANCNEKSEVDLKWSTASEQNSENFIIERSRDLVQWEFVSSINAAGNSNYNIDYSTVDTDPFGGVSYYRMVQVDNNGAEKIYGPISVSCSGVNNSMIVFPNPTKGNFTVEISSDENISNAQIQITDLTGKVINERSANILEGKSQFTFEGLDLQLGTYIINLNTGNGKINPVRVVVN